jgi:hypothetical protein
MKREIDKYFAENYKQLVEIAKARINKYKRNVDAESVVADAYLYLIKRKDDITDDCIGAWVGSYINLEISMSKSVTNVRARQHEDIDGVIIFENSDNIDELNSRMIIEDFATTLDRCDQIILDVYLNKGKTTQRDIAEHFKIDSTSAWLYLKNIKYKLKEYVKTKEGL